MERQTEERESRVTENQENSEQHPEYGGARGTLSEFAGTIR